MTRWTTAQWRAEALDWVAEQGMVPRIVTQPRVTPWSTALRIETDGGVVWLKAAGTGTRYEAGLLRALHAYGAPHLLTPIALDVDRGWMLLPDGGPTLRDVLTDDPDVRHWERVLPKYAQLQRAVEHRALPGTEDNRPERMPELLASLLERLEVDPAVAALQPRFAAWCDELATSGIRSTLQHDDLHDNNVFADDVVFDWGDAALAFPFSSLLVTLRTVRQRWPDADLERLRDAYLEPWTDTHTRAELELLALFATRVGKVGRARAWVRALADVADPGEHAEAAPGWLEELLEEDVF